MFFFLHVRAEAVAVLRRLGNVWSKLQLMIAACGIAAITIGCGGHVQRGRLVDAKAVETAFRVDRGGLNGLVVSPNLLVPLPHGDLGEYTIYTGTGAMPNAPEPLAGLTVLASTDDARQNAGRITKGGLCAAHDDLALLLPFSRCDHFRVANVLLIVSGDASHAIRERLIAALSRLGTPTTT
jgi:hypothetical protein